MSKNSKRPPGPKVRPVYVDGTHLDAFIFEDEDAADFDALRCRIRGVLKPADDVEELLVDDVAHYQWEVAR